MAKYTGTRGAAGWSRRDALRLFGAGGAAALLASCGGDESGEAAPSSPATGAGGEPQLPTEDVDLRWMSNPDQSDFWEPFFEQYEAEHPNISIEFDGVTGPEMQEVMQLGFQNGTAHDVFVTPRIPPTTLVSEGWVAPLNDWIPNFEEWKSQYLPLALPTFDGQVYGVPLNITNGVQSVLFYNRQYLNDAGYDPETEPLSWDDLREAARAVTQAGNGDYYGFVIAGGQANRLGRWVMELSTHAGAGTTLYQGATIDWRTGEFNVTTDEHLGAVELLLAMVDDGSLIPGYTGLAGPAANSTVPQGSAAMMVHLPNFASIWPRGEQGGTPDFDFGVGQPPTPDPQNIAPLSTSPGNSLVFWASADCENLAVAGDLLSRVGSPEGALEYFSTYGIANTPAFEGIYEQIDWSDVEQHTVELVERLWVTGPGPHVRNPEVQTALLEWQPPQPDLGTLMQGILAGEVDPQQGLQQFQDASNAELDRTIEVAQSKGVEVSREDFVFPNWGPTQDYTQDDYAEL